MNNVQNALLSFSGNNNYAKGQQRSVTRTLTTVSVKPESTYSYQQALGDSEQQTFFEFQLLVTSL